MHTYEVTGEILLFPQAGGWHYIQIPPPVTEELAAFADRGLIPVEATIGRTTWPTSLLPMGDGSHFIAINARVRRAEDVRLGDDVTVRFRLRQR